MAIRRIDKAYFPLEDLIDEWQLPKSDLLYVVETGQLRLSYRATRLRLELGEYEEIDQENFQPVFMKDTVYSGLLELHASDARTVLAKGKSAVKSFHTTHPAYQMVDNRERLIEIERSDLLVKKEEKLRFEDEIGIASASPSKAQPLLTHNPTFTEVRIGERTFRFGAVQSNVIRILLKEAQSDRPWVAGKIVLERAGSTSLRLSDLFKSKPNWRELIESDGSGLYRIHSNIRLP